LFHREIFQLLMKKSPPDNSRKSMGDLQLVLEF